MLKVNGNGLLIVVSGPSGAGKDTICKTLVETTDNTWISISMTSRNPRNGEVEGKDYYFVTKEEFEEKIKEGKFLTPDLGGSATSQEFSREIIANFS